MRRHPPGSSGPPETSGTNVVRLPTAHTAPVSTDDPTHPGGGHLPSCGPDCRAGQEMDPYLAGVLTEYDRLLAGLPPEEQDAILRRAWIDPDGGVHVRTLRSVENTAAPPDD